MALIPSEPLTRSPFAWLPGTAMPRLSFTLTVAMLSAFGLIASDVYLPAMPGMATEFGVADWQMPQTVSFYLLALAFAQLAYGPLSDRNGRKPILLGGIVLYIVGSVGCATCTTYNGFLAWRMLEAVGAAAGLVVGRALIADTCDKRTSAKVYAVIYPLVSLSPALAPANRKCSATVVLPVPGSPSSRNTWPRDKPPERMSSSPSIPVAALALINSLDVDKKSPLMTREVGSRLEYA